MCNFNRTYIVFGLGQLSRYSDSLRSARFRDRNPVAARFSAPVQTGPGAHPASCRIGTGSLSRGLSGQGVALTTHSHLAPRLKKEYRYASTHFLGLHGLFWSELYLFYITKFTHAASGRGLETHALKNSARELLITRRNAGKI